MCCRSGARCRSADGVRDAESRAGGYPAATERVAGEAGVPRARGSTTSLCLRPRGGPSPGPSPLVPRGVGENSGALRQASRCARWALTRLVTSPPSPASGRGYKLRSHSGRSGRKLPPPRSLRGRAGEGGACGRRPRTVVEPRPLGHHPSPVVWGRGRQPSRGTSERPGGGEGPPRTPARTLPNRSRILPSPRAVCEGGGASTPARAARWRSATSPRPGRSPPSAAEWRTRTSPSAPTRVPRWCRRASGW
jgi:hypothetical protein